jgi:hypothetical protein
MEASPICARGHGWPSTSPPDSRGGGRIASREGTRHLPRGHRSPPARPRVASREATRRLPRGHASPSARRCMTFHEAVHGLARPPSWPCARSSIPSRRSMRRLIAVVAFGRVRDAWPHRSRRVHRREAVGGHASGRAFAPVSPCDTSAGSVRGLARGHACARVRRETSSRSFPRSHRGTRRHAPQCSSRCIRVMAASFRSIAERAKAPRSLKGGLRRAPVKEPANDISERRR